jgi:hypothetical protein
MSQQIDEFAGSLLEESKRFLELARECEDSAGTAAYLHAAILLAFCALDAHVNAVADDFAEKNVMSTHERAFILERDVELVDGEFQVGERLRMIRIEERIQFLIRHFSGEPLNREASWWSDLKSAIKLRNELTHPKSAINVTDTTVERVIVATINTLDAVFKAIYKREFPSAGRGISSRLDF